MMLIFKTLAEAIGAGFQVESPYADSEGYIHVRQMTANGWASALVRMRA